MENTKEPETSNRPSTYALATAGLLSTLTALVVLALSETVRIPAAPKSNPIVHFAFVFFCAVKESLLVLWPLALVALAASAFGILKQALPHKRRIFQSAEIASLLGGISLCYIKLIEYPKFRGYIPFILLNLFVLAVLIAHSLFFPESSQSPAKARLKKLFGEKLLPAFAFLLFIAFCVLNYRFYYDRYPTLHTCVAMLCFLLFQAGAFSVASSLTLRIRKTRPFLVAIVSFAVVIAVSIPLSGLDRARQYRSDFARFSVIGQETSRLLWEAENTAPSKPGEGAFDPEGIERFQAHSGLPELPSSFNLLNYNILLVTVEALRADQTSMNDPERDLTPNLLGYAQSGAYWFTRAYTGATYTIQSIASLFTMAYPSESGLQIFSARWSGYLTKEHPTVPDYLKEAGYDTFFLPYTGGGSEEGHLGWCWPRFDSVVEMPNDKEILKAAKKELAKRKDEMRPFFGWIFFSAPHAPYTAHFDDMPAATEKDRYRHEVRYADQNIDELLTYMRENGLDKNTIVIIHGDHGEEFREHGKTEHESLYSECARVPLIVKIPGIDGKSSDAPTSLLYVFPWLFSRGSAELATIAKSRMEHIFGPILKATDGAVVSELFGFFGTRSLLAYPEYHFQHDFASDHNELYNIVDDPGEKDNLFNSDDELSKKFLARFDRYAELRKKMMNIQFMEGTPDLGETPQEKQARIDTVAKLKKSSEDEVLAELMRNKSWIVQREAITQLLKRPTLKVETIDALIKMLVTDEWSVRGRVVKELSATVVPGVDERLLHALRSDSPYRNLSYVYGEGKPHTLTDSVDKILKSRKKTARPAIIAALSSEDMALLRYATLAIGTYGASAAEAAPRLQALGESPDPVVRENAAKSLKQVSGTD